MAKRVWSVVIITVALVFVGATLLNTFALYVPKSALGRIRFHWEYNQASDKSSYLDAYRDRIWQHGGGAIPSDVARFLCQRLESSSDEGEVSAITRFYSREAGGREPAALFDLSDKARRHVAGLVLHDWKSYPARDAQRGFILLEGLRQNTWLGKVNVLRNDNWVGSPQKLAPVARLFEEWNSKYSGVPFTKRPSPLAGTPYRIEGP